VARCQYFLPRFARSEARKVMRLDTRIRTSARRLLSVKTLEIDLEIRATGARGPRVAQPCV